MANENYPLLFFPAPTKTDRNPLRGGGGPVHVPEIGRQRARIAPQLTVLQQAFEAKSLRLQQATPVENPELILVLEVAGTVRNFAKAVSKLPGLDWLLEWADEQIEPDEDFYAEGKDEQHKAYAGRLFLLGTNQEALTQLLALWNRYEQNPAEPFAWGLAPFRHVFAQLRTIRYWSVSDRLDADMRRYWQDCIGDGMARIRFEIEAWYFESQQKNDATRAEIDTLVERLGGLRLGRTLIPEIAYHGFLIELPSAAVTAILAGETPELVLSDRVMFFRPKAQSVTDGVNEAQVVTQAEIAGAADKAPVVALLDGLPLSNHVLLAGRLVIDDPDGWEASYEAKDRVHGTAMASLIVHGELDGTSAPLDRKLYVRPIMRPDSSDNYNKRRREHTPDDLLLIDLVHRAVKRICEGDAGQGPAAPSVRVINLSIGDDARLFVREMSPWARLLDWLAYRYSVLFIVSAGNDLRPLTLNAPGNTLPGMTPDARQNLAFTALTSENTGRRLIAPAEAMNALTVGAIHADRAQPAAILDRFDLFASGGLSPLSRVGHGYRRSVKPDILMPGGRVLYRERMVNDPTTSLLDAISASAAPGHRVALPPLPGQTFNETGYSRGTSNAAALASRAATQAYDVIESLRIQVVDAPPAKFDAVLLKALMVHGAHWGGWSDRLLAERPDFQSIENGNTRRIAQKDFITRWLGYGAVNAERAVTCTAERATLLGVGELGADEAFVFSAPLPPSLAGKIAWRRLTLTLAWMSPINVAHQGYRRAKLWVTPPQDQLRIKRSNSVHEKAATRGTVQHEILEGEDAVAFADGDHFMCKVNCVADAGQLTEKVAFALCVSLEVAVGSEIAVYEEIRQRIMPPIGVQPGAGVATDGSP
jgi:hypothetical protein